MGRDPRRAGAQAIRRQSGGINGYDEIKIETADGRRIGVDPAKVE